MLARDSTVSVSRVRVAVPAKIDVLARFENEIDRWILGPGEHFGTGSHLWLA